LECKEQPVNQLGFLHLPTREGWGTYFDTAYTYPKDYAFRDVYFLASAADAERKAAVKQAYEMGKNL